VLDDEQPSIESPSKAMHLSGSTVPPV
jgi:hypothetical protein